MRRSQLFGAGVAVGVAAGVATGAAVSAAVTAARSTESSAPATPATPEPKKLRLLDLVKYGAALFLVVWLIITGINIIPAFFAAQIDGSAVTVAALGAATVGLLPLYLRRYQSDWAQSLTLLTTVIPFAINWLVLAELFRVALALTVAGAALAFVATLINSSWWGRSTWLWRDLPQTQN